MFKLGQLGSRLKALKFKKEDEGANAVSSHYNDGKSQVESDNPRRSVPSSPPDEIIKPKAVNPMAVGTDLEGLNSVGIYQGADGDAGEKKWLNMSRKKKLSVAAVIAVATIIGIVVAVTGSKGNFETSELPMPIADLVFREDYTPGCGISEADASASCGYACNLETHWPCNMFGESCYETVTQAECTSDKIIQNNQRSPPSCYRVESTGNLRCFYRSAGNRLLFTEYNQANGRILHPRSVGGQLAFKPECLSSTTCVFVGFDRSLYMSYVSEDMMIIQVELLTEEVALGASPSCVIRSDDGSIICHFLDSMGQILWRFDARTQSTVQIESTNGTIGSAASCSEDYCYFKTNTNQLGVLKLESSTLMQLGGSVASDVVCHDGLVCYYLNSESQLVQATISENERASHQTIFDLVSAEPECSENLCYFTSVDNRELEVFARQWPRGERMKLGVEGGSLPSCVADSTNTDSQECFFFGVDNSLVYLLVDEISTFHKSATNTSETSSAVLRSKSLADAGDELSTLRNVTLSAYCNDEFDCAHLILKPSANITLFSVVAYDVHGSVIPWLEFNGKYKF
ncbi:MAG: hypothetical protein AB8F74_23415, partial [Saprospiraceae bacterium]